jgi:hypothetical protein
VLFPPTPATISDAEIRDLRTQAIDNAEAVRAVELLAPRVADLEARRPPDIEPLTEDLARANRVIAEMAQRMNEQTDAINALKSRPVAPSRMSETVLGALRAVAMVLAVRFLLLLALFGTFVLAVMAMSSQTYVGLAVAAAFPILSLVPLVVLEVRHRPAPPSP